MTAALKVPRLRLDPEERRALRRAGLRLLDFARLPASDIARATEGAIGRERAAALVSSARLQQLTSIGPSLAEDLRKLGYRAPADLVGEDPERMLRRLEKLSGRQDPCVGDCLACAVHHAEHPRGPAKPWWEFSRERLARRG